MNILVCGIDYEEGRNYSNDPTSNDGMTDMILYVQFDIKNGALRTAADPPQQPCHHQEQKDHPFQWQDLRRTNYQINSVAISNGGSIAALADVIYDQFRLPIDYYVTVDMQALVDMWITLAALRCISLTICPTAQQAAQGLPQSERCIGRVLCALPPRRRLRQFRYRPPEHAALFLCRPVQACPRHGRYRYPEPAAAGVQELYQDGYGHFHHCKAGGVFLKLDSSNIILAQTPVFMGVPNVGKTDTFAGYSCVVPDAGSIANLLNQYFCTYTGPIDVSEMNLVTDEWPHGSASTDANVQYMGRIDKESDDAILSGDTDLDGAVTTDGQAAGSAN